MLGRAELIGSTKRSMSLTRVTSSRLDIEGEVVISGAASRRETARLASVREAVSRRAPRGSRARKGRSLEPMMAEWLDLRDPMAT
jgi:hypothetical protein